jgi:hypothetical protein
MAEHRAPRIWHIEERLGYFYATNQFGGFSRFSERSHAVRSIADSCAVYGDTWQQAE